jgi:glycosyltransferase involved in cell wall biosynthesis
MSSQPLVSVCIPSYNSEAFIGRTIESILDQEFRDFEVVINDDCSPDGTFRVVQEYADPRIRAHRNEANLGLGANWNRTLSLAAGKYIKLVCGDDVLYPGCLRRQVELLEAQENTEAVLTVCRRDVVDAGGRLLLRGKPSLEPGLNSGLDLIRRCIRRGANMLGEPLVGLFRAGLLSRTGMCDPTNPYLIDLALWADLAKHGQVFVDSRCLGAFRVSSRAVSARLGMSQAHYFRRFAQRIRRDPAFGVSQFDVLLGSALSSGWCLARNLFIRYKCRDSTSRREPGGTDFPAAAPLKEA